MSGTPTLHCSIVIRAYNEEQHIGRLLTGILSQSVEDREIILVDSGSTDATVAIANRYPVQVVSIRPEDFTFGRALNLGISHALGEYIVIASAHVYPVYTDWLARLLAPFENPDIVLTYGKQRGDASTKFSEHQFFAQWFPEDSQLRQPHPFCNNANAAIRRSWWEAQPYDEVLTGLEDLAWARTAMDRGGAIAYVAEAEIVHVHHETPRQVYNRYRREAMAFKQIFPEERFGTGNFLRLVTTNSVSDLWHAARQGMFRANWRTILWFRLMQFWGTYQGYRTSGPVTNQLRQIFYYPRSLRASPAPPPRRAEPIAYHEAGKQSKE
jgi:glycosyltransferase involved in cell wall biosynthesis